MSSYYDERYVAMRGTQTGHTYADLSRYSRGMTAIRPARPLYGWRYTCECGESVRTNESKRDAIRLWRDHARYTA